MVKQGANSTNSIKTWMTVLGIVAMIGLHVGFTIYIASENTPGLMAGTINDTIEERPFTAAIDPEPNIIDEARTTSDNPHPASPATKRKTSSVAFSGRTISRFAPRVSAKNRRIRSVRDRRPSEHYPDSPLSFYPKVSYVFVGERYVVRVTEGLFHPSDVSAKRTVASSNRGLMHTVALRSR